jgi:putative SOS response-associated peptidase YedK
MCNLYSHTKGQKAIRDIANAMGGVWLDSAGNLEPQPGIFPDSVAPVNRKTTKGRELLKMRWGFPSPPQAKSKYTTNVRKTTSNFWKPWLKPEYHCLVPVTSFANRTGYPERLSRHGSPWMKLARCSSLLVSGGLGQARAAQTKSQPRASIKCSRS